MRWSTKHCENTGSQRWSRDHKETIYSARTAVQWSTILWVKSLRGVVYALFEGVCYGEPVDPWSWVDPAKLINNSESPVDGGHRQPRWWLPEAARTVKRPLLILISRWSSLRTLRDSRRETSGSLKRNRVEGLTIAGFPTTALAPGAESSPSVPPELGLLGLSDFRKIRHLLVWH